MHEVKFIVQKIPSRGVKHLQEAIPDLIVVESIKVLNENVFATMRRAFEAAGESAHVHLEDDIIVCENFHARIMEVIEQHPDEVISFFTLRHIKETCTKPGRDFLMFQCVYVPAGLSPKFVEYIHMHWNPKKTYAQHKGGIDGMFAQFLASEGLRYRLWVPNLVQHRDLESGINPSRSKSRQSALYQHEDPNSDA